MKKKTLGVIGGIGPESTTEYYRLLIARYREQNPDGSYPSIIINSIDLSKVVAMVSANELTALAEFLSHEIERLAKAGADFGLLSANTPHVVFDQLRQRSPIPLISIVEATCDAAKAMGLRRLGLLGTRFTMQARFYPEVFSREAVALVVPEEKDQTYIHNKYMNELIKGIFLPETQEGLLAIVERLKDRENIGGIILGGTELPLIFAGSDSQRHSDAGYNSDSCGACGRRMVVVIKGVLLDE